MPGAYCRPRISRSAAWELLARTDCYGTATADVVPREELLPRAGKTESWLLAKLQVKRLDDLLYARAELVIRRLGELARERANAQP